MKLDTIIGDAFPDDLRKSIFLDRAKQFVGRHSWDLCITPDGYEVDEYDGDDSDYLVVHREGKHLTSCRLRRFSTRTMLRDHFSHIFPAAEPFLKRQSRSLIELTRFLRSPDLSSQESVAALIKFARGLDRFRDANGSVGFVAVVYPGVVRFLRQNGVRYLILDESMLQGKRVNLICLTQAVASSDLLVQQRAFARGKRDLRPATIGRPMAARSRQIQWENVDVAA